MSKIFRVIVEGGSEAERFEAILEHAALWGMVVVSYGDEEEARKALAETKAGLRTRIGDYAAGWVRAEGAER